MMRDTVNLRSLTMADLPEVGGKNASLGEMIAHLSDAGVKVPGGFATTASAYRSFIHDNHLDDSIKTQLRDLDVSDTSTLASVGSKIRTAILNGTFSNSFERSITQAYHDLVTDVGHEDFTVAVRSSATAEDLPDASFAGQQETFLNIKGIAAILSSIKEVYASLFNDRAIAYRVHHGFSHDDVALSVGIQLMVRSDEASSGVMFTLDTESGFSEVVFITSSYGLGEMVVQGAVNPDEFYVYKQAIKQNKSPILRRQIGQKALKMIFNNDANAERSVKTIPVDDESRLRFSLSDEEVIFLAEQAMIIEEHYKRPMDIEWAKDGITGEMWILQARPETVKSRASAHQIERYTLKEKGAILAEGRSIGQRIGKGVARIIHSASEMHKVNPGDVLVSDITDPDWEPVMKKASAIVTNRGGRTCHAAIIARELGIPAVVGCSDATKTIKDGQMVTVSCAEGDVGFVYEGDCDFEHTHFDIQEMPKLPVKIMLNVGHPDRAFTFHALPNHGVGLARLEFLISNSIGIHPRALVEYDTLTDKDLKQKIHQQTFAYGDPVRFYVERLKEGIATIAAAFYPKPVIVRLSDFKSNEYAHLLGGQMYEPQEENPMIGFRGASRYISSDFEACFAMECQAIIDVREKMGLTNVELMIPFVRTVNEAELVVELLKKYGLERGKNGLRLIMMCEIPSNALLAEKFLPYFDGFSIGSNDLTQLTLGLDRDSSLVASQFDERNDAVKMLLTMAIDACKKQGKYIGICGQGPSDHPDFARWLLDAGIESISLNPDSVVETCLFLAKNFQR